jgi:hypothetical protein
MRKQKYSAFIYGEGCADKNFIIRLFKLKKFKFYTEKNWTFNYGNASGSSVETVLLKCRKAVFNRSFDLILCFVDVDRLKQDFKEKWLTEQKKIENKYPEIYIIWQYDKAEDEYKKALGENFRSKRKLNKLAKEKIDKFVNSNFWNRILTPIKNKEAELKKLNIET